MNWILCKLGWHFWGTDTMSMEAYAQEFYFCLHCGVMHFKRREKADA